MTIPQSFWVYATVSVALTCRVFELDWMQLLGVTLTWAWSLAAVVAAIEGSK